MSKIAIKSSSSGTATFTIESPSTNTDRTLVLPDVAGTVATAESTLAQFNVTGSAPVFACRAWVNFNGTGTVSIRASGNVSSISDLGTGRYQVNFTTAMPDGNYVAQITTAIDGTIGVAGQARTGQLENPGTMLTTSCVVGSLAVDPVATTDSGIMCVSIFR